MELTENQMRTMEKIPLKRYGTSLKSMKLKLPMGIDNPFVQYHEIYVQVELRSKMQLHEWFMKLTNFKQKLDPTKLYEVVNEEFKEYADRVFDILKRVFGNFKIPIDFDLYCDTIQKFISIEEDVCKQIMFEILDHNKDKKICETDLFNCIKSINNTKIYALLAEDIQLTLKYI